VCAHPGVKHTTGEPPSHRDCAEFAVRACPFLTQREEERRTIGLPGEISKAPGFGIPHNPGVALLWITKTYRPWPVPEEAVREAGAQPSVLFAMGEPLVIECYREGCDATRAEIAAGPGHAATGPSRGASRLPVSSACGNDPSQPLPLVGEHDGAVAGALEVRSSLDDRETRKGRPVWLKVVTRSLAGMRPFSPCGLSLTGTSSSGAARRRSTQRSRDEQVPP